MDGPARILVRVTLVETWEDGEETEMARSSACFPVIDSKEATVLFDELARRLRRA